MEGLRWPAEACGSTLCGLGRAGDQLVCRTAVLYRASEGFVVGRFKAARHGQRVGSQARVHACDQALLDMLNV